MQGENIFEIPKYVRYDFLITLLGIFCLGTGWYFTFIANISIESVGLLFVIGIPLFIWGIFEMADNYKEERDLHQLQIILEKKEIFDDLVKHKILDKTKTKFLIIDLKKEIWDIINKKKEDS